VWNGNIGTFDAEAEETCREHEDLGGTWRACRRVAGGHACREVDHREAVAPAMKNTARSSRASAPSRTACRGKNLIGRVLALLATQTPIMKYIGRSTISKKTKNRIRSWARGAEHPVCRIRMRIRNALGLCAREVVQL